MIVFHYSTEQKVPLHCFVDLDYLTKHWVYTTGAVKWEIVFLILNHIKRHWRTGDFFHF